MTFSYTKQLYLLIILFMSTSCYEKEAPPRKDVSPNNISQQDTYKEKITMLTNVKIESLYLLILTRKNGIIAKTNHVIKDSSYHKFKNAITKESKPFGGINVNPETIVDLKSYGYIVFSSGNREKITIDICGKAFFWEGKRKYKYAFVSKTLTELIIKEIKGIKGAEWIVTVLQDKSLGTRQ